MKKIAVLGSTGSIGTQTLDVVRANKDIEVKALAAGRNIKKLEEQIREFHPDLAAVWDEKDAGELRARTADLQVIDTGSVALTQAFAGWYERVNAQDPAAQISIGQVNTRFLSEAAGAHGAALWRPRGDAAEENINKRPVTAFAVSYAQERGEAAGAGAPGAAGSGAGQPGAGGPGAGGTGVDGSGAAASAMSDPTAAGGDHVFAVAGGEDATELTVGSVDGNLEDLRSLIARLSVDTPVVVEVTDAMETERELVDQLVEAGSARVLESYTTLVRD